MKTLLLLACLFALPAQADMVFKPEPNFNLGVHSNLQGTQGFAGVSFFLLNDFQDDHSNLLGLGVGLDTDANSYIMFQPMSVPIGNFSIQPTLNFSLSHGDSRIGLAAGFYF